MAATDLVLAMSGASGAPYGVRLLEVLLQAGRTIHLTLSPAAVEVLEQELDGTRCIALPARTGKQVVADVHLAGLEPVVLEVVVDPPDQLVTDPDTGCGARLFGSWAEPPEELLVLPATSNCASPGRGGCSVTTPSLATCNSGSATGVMMYDR